MRLLLILLSTVIFHLTGTAQTDSLMLQTSDGTRLFVKHSGQGPLCIFIHGGPGAWSRSFEALGGNQLERNMTMVYYDQRGCGRSDSAARGDYSLPTMIADIEAIRRHFGAEQVFLMAHSFGGILAINYALQYPGHVKGVIMNCATLSLRYSLNNQLDYMNRLMDTDYQPADSSAEELIQTFVKAKTALIQRGLSYKMLSEDKAHVACLDSLDGTNPGNYAFAGQVFSIPSYWQDFTLLSAKIEVPVLVISGAADHSIGENHYLDFNFPRQRTVQLPGGHLLYYDFNAQFVQTVFDFVKDV